MFLATERACGSKKHTARITMISLGGCPGHLRGWNGTTRRTEALTDTSRRQGTGRHPIPGCRSNCARRPDGLDGERARPRGHAAAEQRLTRPGLGGNPFYSSRAKVLVSTAYLRARPQKVAGKTRTHLARVCAPSGKHIARTAHAAFAPLSRCALTGGPRNGRPPLLGTSKRQDPHRRSQQHAFDETR